MNFSDHNYFQLDDQASWKDVAERIKNGVSKAASDEDRKAQEEHHSQLALLSQEREHGQLALDIYQTASDLIIEAPIAGVRPEDLDISMHDDVLTIKGTRRRSEEVHAKNLLYQECHWGTFSRSIVLPVEVVAERIEAVLRDGILTIRMPKAQPSRKIQVKSG